MGAPAAPRLRRRRPRDPGRRAGPWRIVLGGRRRRPLRVPSPRRQAHLPPLLRADHRRRQLANKLHVSPGAPLFWRADERRWADIHLLQPPVGAAPPHLRQPRRQRLQSFLPRGLRGVLLGARRPRWRETSGADAIVRADPAGQPARRCAVPLRRPAPPGGLCGARRRGVAPTPAPRPHRAALTPLAVHLCMNQQPNPGGGGSAGCFVLYSLYINIAAALFFADLYYFV